MSRFALFKKRQSWRVTEGQPGWPRQYQYVAGSSPADTARHCGAFAFDGISEKAVLHYINVDMYREGRWAETPDGVKDPKNFKLMIRRWARIEDENGPEALKHQGRDKKWTPEEKLDLVTKVLAGETNQSVAIKAGISDGLLYE